MSYGGESLVGDGRVCEFVVEAWEDYRKAWMEADAKGDQAAQIQAESDYTRAIEEIEEVFGQASVISVFEHSLRGLPKAQGDADPSHEGARQGTAAG